MMDSARLEYLEELARDHLGVADDEVLELALAMRIAWDRAEGWQSLCMEARRERDAFKAMYEASCAGSWSKAQEIISLRRRAQAAETRIAELEALLDEARGKNQ